MPGNDTLRSVFLLADGRIVACGETSGTASDGFVVRLNLNGTADSSFTGAVYGVSGISDPSDDINVVLDCAVDPNGNYVICGGKNGERSDANGNPLGDFFLARYCGN